MPCKNLFAALANCIILDTMAHRSGGEWHAQPYPEVDNQAHLAAFQTTTRLTVRVRDDPIRSMVKDLMDKCRSVVLPSTNKADSDRFILEAAHTYEMLNERIGERLRQLDDDEDAHDQREGAQ